MAAGQTKSINDLKKQRIGDALETLDDAARNTKEDLVEMLKDKYYHLKDSLQSMFEDSGLSDVAGEAKNKAQQAFKQSSRVARQTVSKVDGSVHTSPWTYIGASALVGLAAGIYLARRD